MPWWPRGPSFTATWPPGKWSGGYRPYISDGCRDSVTKPAKRVLPERGARHAIVYWFPATLDPPRGLPVGRQWSICQALSRHTEVVVLSGGTPVVNRPTVRQLSETLWFVEGAFGTAW